MKLTINGQQTLVPDGITLACLVEQQGFNPAVIVIEYNQKIIKKEAWADVVLQSSDCLEIITFVGGG